MALETESELVWLMDIRDIDYVREGHWVSGSRTRPPAKQWNETRVVGYTRLKPKAEVDEDPFRSFHRRIFTLRTYDRYYDPEGTYRIGCPSEAVDPRTVIPTQKGRLTDRAWGDILPSKRQKQEAILAQTDDENP